MNILVFDVETIPDIDSGKKIFNLEGLSDKNAAELMFSHRYQKSNGRTEFLQHYLHKIVTISVVSLGRDTVSDIWPSRFLRMNHRGRPANRTALAIRIAVPIGILTATRRITPVPVIAATPPPPRAIRMRRVFMVIAGFFI